MKQFTDLPSPTTGIEVAVIALIENNAVTWHDEICYGGGQEYMVWRKGGDQITVQSFNTEDEFLELTIAGVTPDQAVILAELVRTQRETARE